ncbi:MAG: hypothetical protein ACSHXF_10220 [Aquaticitalea sp.]
MTVLQMAAQETTTGKSIPIPAVETEEEKKDSSVTPILIMPENKPSLTTKKEDNLSGIPVKNRVTMKPTEKEFSMMEKSDLIDPGKMFEEKWANEKRKKQLEIYDDIPPELLGDQFLGDFKTKSGVVNVICRDFGEQDGDLIKVLLNDEVIVAQLVLTNGYKSFNIPLVDGINKIDFFAINQGSLGFNTAEFKLYDDKETQISENKWFLATSKKASLVILKEE